jgi:hypothetical protein
MHWSTAPQRPPGSCSSGTHLRRNKLHFVFYFVIATRKRRGLWLLPRTAQEQVGLHDARWLMLQLKIMKANRLLEPEIVQTLIDSPQYRARPLLLGHLGPAPRRSRERDYLLPCTAQPCSSINVDDSFSDIA